LTPVLAVFLGLQPALAGSVALATYRAVHDLVIDPASEAPDIGTMIGRMVVEFSGSDCAGYKTTTRFVTASEDGDGARQVVDARSVIFETNDGRFDFDNQTYEDEGLSDSSKGTAERGAGGVTVTLTEPARKTLELSADVVFPTEQLTRIIEAARAGDRFLSFSAYDAIDAGETVSPTTVVIGAESTASADVGVETAIADAGYATLLHWPVTVSYFDKGPGIDQAPTYTLSAILYDNGIMRQLKLNYGRFTLLGKLVQLDTLPKTPCE